VSIQGDHQAIAGLDTLFCACASFRCTFKRHSIKDSVILRLFSRQIKMIMRLNSKAFPDKESRSLEMDYEARRN
jgi:hypothetical protein